jgi:hypothetical protein
MPRAVAVDFDGVIHAYSKGWQDGTIYDGPVPGAIDGLRKLMETFAVFVHTTRPPRQVGDWLRGYVPVLVEHPGVRREFWDQLGAVYITNRKLPAVAYIDDRAIRFTTWAQALDDLAVQVIRDGA